MSSAVTVDLLSRALAAWNIEIDEVARGRFARYADLLLEWNRERLNLTRLTSPKQIAIDHFLDSVAPLKVVAVPEGAKLLDIGTGAGFPGLAIKIMRPDLRVTLMEATGKKLEFCRAVAQELELVDIEFRHGRAEDRQMIGEMGRSQEVVTARALASMTTLLEWAEPYLADLRSQMIAWKGPKGRQELREAQSVARKLRIKSRVIDLALPLSGEPERVSSYIVSSRVAEV